MAPEHGHSAHTVLSTLASPVDPLQLSLSFSPAQPFIPSTAFDLALTPNHNARFLNGGSRITPTVCPRSLPLSSLLGPTFLWPSPRARCNLGWAHMCTWLCGGSTFAALRAVVDRVVGSTGALHRALAAPVHCPIVLAHSPLRCNLPARWFCSHSVSPRRFFVVSPADGGAHLGALYGGLRTAPFEHWPCATVPSGRGRSPGSPPTRTALGSLCIPRCSGMRRSRSQAADKKPHSAARLRSCTEGGPT